MDIKLKLQLVQQAQRELVLNPQDPMHDVTHHYRVAQLARQIISEENLSDKLDPDFIEVICWWHDVQVAGISIPEGRRIVAITAEYLAKLLPDEIQQLAQDSIGNHEFGSDPQYLEGKVLQDADKLEILSPARVDTVVDNIRAGILDRDKMLATLQSVRNDWLPRMPERYHFEFSRNYHKDHLASFLEYLERAEILIRAL